MKKLRASSLPMLARCGCFTSKPFNTALTIAGTNRHEALEDAIKNGNRTKLEALPDEDREGVEWAEDYILTHMTKEFPMEWESGKGFQVNCDGAKITGRWDLINGRDGYDLKWRLPTEGKSNTEQAAMYSTVIMHRDSLSKFRYHMIYAQAKVVKVLEFTREQAQKILEDVVANVAKNEQVPNPDCGWCALSDGRCDALHETAMVVGKEYQNELTTYDHKALSDPVQLGRALTFVRNLKPMIEEIERLAKQHTIEKGGSLVGFKVTERSLPAKVKDLNAAFNAVGLPSENFMQACSLVLTRLYEEWASAHSVSKAEAKRECQARLATAFAPKQTVKCLTKIKSC